MRSRTNSVPDGSDATPLLFDDLEAQLESEGLQAHSQEDAQESNSGWLSGFVSGAKNVGRSLWNTTKAVGTALASGARHFKQHPFASTFGLVTAAPVALFALTGPSGSNPSKIGKTWWLAMSIGKRIYSIACGGASFTINGIMNARFLVTTPKKFFSTIKTTFKSPGDFAISISAIGITLASGAGAWMLSYKAFTWLPYGEVLAVAPASLAALIMAFSRYPSIAVMLKKPGHLLRNHFRFQRAFADKLDHINQAHLEEVERELREIITTLRDHYGDIDIRTNHEAYEKLLKQLSAKLSDLSEVHPDLIRDTSNGEYAKYYASVLFDTTLALALFAAAAFITFSQKGYDAVSLVSKFATGESLDSLDEIAKILIGLPSGLASAMYYGNSGLGLRETMVQVVTELYRAPGKIPAYLALFGINGLASGSMFNVARGIVAEDNLYGIKDNMLGSTYRIAQGVSAVAVNTIITSREALLGKDEDVHALNISAIANDLRYQEEQVLSNESIAQMKHLGLWSRNRRRSENDASVQLVTDDEHDSSIYPLSEL